MSDVVVSGDVVPVVLQSTKSEKDVMRPLYDRYRNIKKLLAKPVSVSQGENVPRRYVF